MKLYYSPGACSLASHIVLKELGTEHSIEKVDLRAKTTQSGADYKEVNPKGSVPALATAEGVLTEGAAILQFLADKAGNTVLAPAVGTMARARVQELLNFVATEVHKAYSPLFTPGLAEDAKLAAKANIARRLGQVEGMLADGRDYLMGSHFSLADAYVFTVTNWSKMTGVDMSGFPKLEALRGRIAARPAVQEAMKAEGLIA